MISTEKLLIYKDFENGDILEDVIWVANQIEDGMIVEEDLKKTFFKATGDLVSLAFSHGFEGNLWHAYLAYLLADNENAYSMACEIRGEVEGSINTVAKHDMAVFKKLFDLDLTRIDRELDIKCCALIMDYQADHKLPKVFNKRIRDRILELAQSLAGAEDVATFKTIVTEFYKDFGVGKFGLHKAFRVERTDEGVEILPITNTTHVTLDDLVGYDIPKKKLIDNTESYVSGKKANNCLLFGDAGTGKSTSVKAILNQYYPRGLRMIEIYKHQFEDLKDVLAQIKNRNYKFIIFMDDLSFEEFEIEYKYLKAVIEGGLENRPDNVLIYATSNRRHLVKERVSDKTEYEDDLHSTDTIQEKLSLVARFGVTIYFGSPDKREFENIVRELAIRNDVKMPADELMAEANKWELSHGGLSGRCAQQFVDYLLGLQND